MLFRSKRGGRSIDGQSGADRSTPPLVGRIPHRIGRLCRIHAAPRFGPRWTKFVAQRMHNSASRLFPNLPQQARLYSWTLDLSIATVARDPPMLRPPRPPHCSHTIPQRAWLVSGLLAAFCLLGCLPKSSWGQAPETTAKASAPDFDWKGALPKFRLGDRDLAGARAESGQLPAEGPDRRLLLGVETVSLPVMYGGQNQNQRFLAIQVILANLTVNPLTVARQDVELVVDGQSILLYHLQQDSLVQQ